MRREAAAEAPLDERAALGSGGTMEISPRTLLSGAMIAGHEARSERHDARITVGSLPLCTVRRRHLGQGSGYRFV